MNSPPSVGRKSLSIVVPVYREGEHLESFLKELEQTLETIDLAYEILVVDDGSTDDTWSVIERAVRNRPKLSAVRLSRNFGKESALSAGLELARGDAVIVMDADLQHPSALIPQMVKLWLDLGVDIVETTKEDRGDEAWTRRWGARVFYAILSRSSGFDLRGASDFKLLDRRVLQAWRMMGERALFFRGMISWLGFSRAQVPFGVGERTGGRSHWSLWRLVVLAVRAVSAFSSAPLHLVTVAGILFLAFALVMGLQTLYMKFSGVAVSGFTTVILLLLLIGSVLMFALGTIGIYVERIYEEVKGRPRYVVRQMAGASSLEQDLHRRHQGTDVGIQDVGEPGRGWGAP
jgi:glycosyltransferase involved in cell wall biosynthesis